MSINLKLTIGINIQSAGITPHQTNDMSLSVSAIQVSVGGLVFIWRDTTINISPMWYLCFQMTPVDHRLQGWGSNTECPQIKAQRVAGSGNTLDFIPIPGCASIGNARNVFPATDFKRAVMHVGITNPRWRGKRSRHCRRMRNLQFYVSSKSPLWYCYRVFWRNWLYEHRRGQNMKDNISTNVTKIDSYLSLQQCNIFAAT